MKKCTKCKQDKPLSEFRERRLKTMISKISVCFTCESELLKNRRRTKKGLCSIMYGGMRRNAKQRNHSLPNFTNEEFKFWLLGQEYFHKLYDNWVASGYRKDVKPSIDRINDDISYVFSNMEVTYWALNKHKNEFQVKHGLKVGSNKPVKMIDGQVEKHFFNAREAERETGVSYKCISNCVLGKTKTAGGKYWLFV